MAPATNESPAAVYAATAGVTHWGFLCFLRNIKKDESLMNLMLVEYDFICKNTRKTKGFCKDRIFL